MYHKRSGCFIEEVQVELKDFSGMMTITGGLEKALGVC